MNNIKYLKISTIIFFLLITFPDKLTLCNLLVIPIGIFASLIDLLCIECNHIESFKNLFILLLVFLSIFLSFSKKKNLFLLSVIIQYLFLLIYFKVKFLNYWYYTIPTLVYIVLSLILIYLIMFKKMKK